MSIRRKKLPFGILIFIFGCFAAACGESWQNAVRQDSDSGTKRPPIIGEKISPGHCRIIGTVISIDEKFRVSNPNDPCSKAPCLAVIRVESILGYGSSFGSPLAKGKEINVLFRFTLSSTKELLPNLTTHYPGLVVGSQFQAEVESLSDTALEEERAGRSSRYRYIIYGYDVK